MNTETLRRQDAPVAPAVAPIPWLAVLAGLCASFVGIGLARFAYSPLIPPLIQAHWFAAADVVYLGAANLAGYLAGALLGRPLARRMSNRHILRLMMLVASVAFLACAFPLSALWFFCWRFASGVAGGVIMVLVAATVLPHIPAARKGMASGAIFMGAGLGVAASGTVVPLLLQLGLQQTWLGLGLLSLAVTAISWQAWPPSPPATATSPTPAPAQAAQPQPRYAAHGTALKVLYGQYALMAAGLVPMMMFLVDYVARGLGQGAHVGSLYWVLYGLGAIVGPLLYGWLADRRGFGPTLRAVMLLQVLVVALFASTGNAVIIGIASVLIGMFPAGIPGLALGRLHEMMPHDQAGQNAAWTRATTMFALFQALSAYAYSYLFEHSGGSYRLMFVLGAGAIAIAFAADLVTAALAARNQNSRGEVQRCRA
ncbi:MAG: YbfB/YjiJ family MFS transporter [Pseudomonadota bacterium]